eukprot:SAG22_NODE_5308_length_1040_cov_1.315622_1_plen_123_part_10
MSRSSRFEKSLNMLLPPLSTILLNNGRRVSIGVPCTQSYTIRESGTLYSVSFGSTCSSNQHTHSSGETRRPRGQSAAAAPQRERRGLGTSRWVSPAGRRARMRAHAQWSTTGAASKTSPTNKY